MQMRFFQLLLPTLLPHPRVDPPSKFLLVSKSGCKPFGWEMSEIVSSTSKVFFLVISYDTPATVCTPSQLLSVFSLFSGGWNLLFQLEHHNWLHKAQKSKKGHTRTASGECSVWPWHMWPTTSTAPAGRTVTERRTQNSSNP